MFYITDSIDLRALEDAQLTMLVVDLEALKELMRDEDIESRVMRSINAKVLSDLLGVEIKAGLRPLKKSELKKGDQVLVLIAKWLHDKISAYLLLALI